MTHNPLDILKNYFGYDKFRPLQEDIINNILKGNDTLAVMPTGGGKSICYQLPAVMSEGLTVVVTPLISLMKDQVEQLAELGIEAVYLNSSLKMADYYYNVERLRSGKVKLFYAAPETLLLDKTLDILRELKVECITVDEAHCISEWGHDFRPEYRKLTELRQFFPQAAYAAFTATATPKVQEDIAKNLNFKNYKKFTASFDRKNLYLEVREKIEPVSQTIKFLNKYPNQSGIIYCATRRQVDSLTEELSEKGFSVRPYHAGLKESERQLNQELFIRDDVKIIVATIAFGMGINKSNVRFVVHFDLPKNLESYYQEIGRSGRDGMRAHCLLLYGDGDIGKIEYFISLKESEKERRNARAHLKSMLDYTEYFKCRRKPLLEYFGENYDGKNCGMCDNCASSQKHLEDITIPAQKFLSCVIRAGEYKNSGYIVSILNGAGNPEIIKSGHDRLSTYGIGKEYNHQQWFKLATQFREEGLISADEEHKVYVTEKGKSFLKNREILMGKLPVSDIEENVTVTFENYDAALFDILSKLRKALADSAGIPPYVIFSDNSLSDMSVRLPRSKEEFLAVSGVNILKYEKYGARFIELIRDYCSKNKKETKAKNSKQNKTLVIGRRVYHEMGEKFASGSSISDLMNLTKYKRSKIIANLLKFAEEGNKLPDEALSAELSLREPLLSQVIKQFNENGSFNEKAVFSAMNGQVTMDDISLVKMILLNKNN